ncbi:MAG: IPT/TIG domain-containing protein [Gammaproteobacteria bacterium]|nr:IPT/TIG domain-containing protein [Gammaproteobacteria bacterium]
MNISRTILRSISLLAFAVLMSACGGESGGPFSVSPGSLSFSAQIDGTAPASKTLTITANEANAAVPDIIASGNAIDFGASSSCAGGNEANLACTLSSDDTKIYVTVPVPDPDVLGIGTHTGSIAITSGGHTNSVSVTYTVEAGTPAVSQVSPYVTVSGQTQTVTIRGGGFTNFGTTIPTVSFGGTPGTNATVVNDTTITVDTPSLFAQPQGYEVTVSGSSVNFPSSATLKVISTTNYADASIAYNSAPPRKVLFDDERRAIYAVNAIDNRLEKYTYNGSSWDATPTTLSLSGTTIADVALSTDGSTLIMVKNDNFVYEVNPDTMLLQGSTQAYTPFTGTLNCSSYDACLDRVAHTSDGRIMAVNNNTSYVRDFYLYDPASNTVEASSNLFTYPDNGLRSPEVYGSATGDRVFLTDTYDPRFYDSMNRSFISFSSASADPVALDGDGTVIASGYNVYKDSGLGYNSQSTIPGSGTIDAMALSYDGNTAYIYRAGDIEAYDISLASPPPATPVTPMASPGTGVQMILSRDEGTAILAGSSALVIVDLP